jgi:hypothetical protein
MEQEEKYKDLKKIFDGKLLAKNEEISRLQDHNQELLTQIKKSKDTKQCVSEVGTRKSRSQKKLSEKMKKLLV